MPRNRRRPHAKTDYTIKLSSERHPHRVPKLLFLIYLSLGLIVRVEGRRARVRNGYAAWLDHDGRIQFQNLHTSTGPSIFTNSQVIERHWIYKPDGACLTPEQRNREFLASYGIFAAPIAA